MTSWEGTTGGRCDEPHKVVGNQPVYMHPHAIPGLRRHYRHLAEGLEVREGLGSEPTAQPARQHQAAPLGQKENLEPREQSM